MFARSAIVKAPSLPALKLETMCYAYMFSYCSRLEQAPVLPAEVLADGCYQGMFQYTSSLSRVEVHALDLSAPDCTTNWLLDTSPHGLFICRPEAAWPSNRTCHGIPKGWEIRELPVK